MKIHIEKGSMECSSCHEVAADGQFAGNPARRVAAPATPSLWARRKPRRFWVTSYVAPEREVDWKVYSAGSP
ncbi:MAG: hypothetical protein IPJ98_28325 [Bryobacterales bacterium]|nr:hypothetical protein [Bryobacterales bacterium]